VLHDGEAVLPGEGDRVGVEEIAGLDLGRLGTQELTPTRSGASRSRIDAGLVQDPPDRGSAYLPAQAGKFPGDSAVPPGRILCGQAQRERADCWPNRRATRRRLLVVPALLYQIGVPAQERARCDQQPEPA
jgi:hypothetical protein